MNLTFKHCGYSEVYDYCQLMIIKLNSKQWVAKNFSLPGSEMADIERAEKIAAIYPQADRRLKIFFDTEYRDVSFLSNYMYEAKCDKNVHTIDDLFVVIKADGNFKEKLFRYYLGEIYQTEQEIVHAMMIGFEGLDSSYKEMLMYFIMFEKEYMDLLFASMMYVRDKLRQIYKEEIKKLRELERMFDFDVIAEQKRTLKKWANSLEEVEISFSYCNQYVVIIGENVNKHSWMILGCEFLESLGHRWNLEVPIEKFGNAIGDEMRIRIIKEVQKYGEVSAPQLAKILNIPSSAMFYHLDVLKKASVLCARMEGRTAYYWINQMAFEQVVTELRKLGGLLR